MRYLLILLVLYTYQLNAQQVYWVTFSQKDSTYFITKPESFLSTKSIARRKKYAIAITESDLPINGSYLQYFREHQYKIVNQSRWLNAVTVSVSNKKYADSLRLLPFVKNVRYLGEYNSIKTANKPSENLNEMLTVLESRFESKQKKQLDSNFYGKSFSQLNMLNAQTLHKAGFYGEGIDIAVIDAGFQNANKIPVFKQLLDSNRIRMTVDFVQGNADVYEDDSHGTAVLSCMAGYLPNEFIGTAPFANYYLFRSEYTHTEMPIEETYWIEAIEYADSIGIDLVNSSLGYNEFDDMSLNYAHKDLNGKTALISKAAAMAVQKGMVVLVSAGNEGDSEWRLVSFPADASELITVGSVDKDGRYSGFSSTGLTADKRIKPDVVAQGDHIWVASARGVMYQGDGTSYSCPLLAGAVACLLQANPAKTPKEIMSALHISGSNYYKPDKYVGYGIPNMQLAYNILTHDTAEQLMDVRHLNDKKIHLLYYSNHVQKVKVLLKNSLNEDVYEETCSIKQVGINRFALKKMKKIKSGMYSLQLTSKNYTVSQSIQIP